MKLLQTTYVVRWKVMFSQVFVHRVGGGGGGKVVHGWGVRCSMVQGGSGQVVSGPKGVIRWAMVCGGRGGSGQGSQVVHGLRGSSQVVHGWGLGGPWSEGQVIHGLGGQLRGDQVVHRIQSIFI